MWKTTDGGLTWKPIFDKQKTLTSSIGAIAVAESDPNVIYVGTGEACIRGNIVGGDGVYKSIDAGKTWTHVGLRDTRAIGRLIVHPRNPQIALVAALGHPYGANTERGVFRTTDGGKTWERVLYKNDKTGAIDLAFDPSNPNIIFAALWEAHRTPYSLESGGPGSGLYRSADGGATWKHLEGNGLPKTIMGRIGVTVSGGDPNRVWALVEAEKGGVFRSDDGGENWKLINEDRRFRQRAWYYTHIFADPKNADSVYILNTGTYRSSDGGKTFAGIPTPHGDNHGLWIDPTNPRRMINSNDGGVTISTNNGQTWSSQYNQPTAQFYHVITDNRFPYYVYGAQQDNSSVGIASASDEGSIDRADWYQVGGCESGYVAPNPLDPNIVYAGCYSGSITRFDKRTGATQEISAWPLSPIGAGAADLKHRFQWTEPILFSPHDPHVLYHASEVLFKTTDEGMSWTPISPDLTRNDKTRQQASGGPITKDNTGVEVYDTIFSVAESPVQKDLIWVGSDDGLVHITTDGGAHWTNITPSGMPEWGLVSLIEPSPHDAATAYMAVERHKLDDNMPYIYKTSDYGKSWRKITEGLPAVYVHAVREDPRRRGLLYAGTEAGVYVSFNDGGHWQPLQLDLPVSPVNDLVVKNDDLVVATHGRSFWILDDISPVQQYSPSQAAEEVHLFTPRPANHTVFGGGRDAGNAGKNPPPGAVIYYTLKTSLTGEAAEKKDKGQTADAAAEPRPDDAKSAEERMAEAKTGQGKSPSNPSTGETAPKAGAATSAETAAGGAGQAGKKDDSKEKPKITLEILDSGGKVIRKYPEKEVAAPLTPEAGEPREKKPLPGDAGLNRFVWDLKYEGSSKVANSPLWGGSTDGPEALPGMYQVRLTVLGKSYVAPLQIIPDPRLRVTPAELEKQFELRLRIRDRVTQAHDAVNQIKAVRQQMEALNKHLEESKDPHAAAIAAAGKELDKKMMPVEEAIIQTKSKSGQDVLNYPVRLNNQLVALGGAVESADAAPTKQEYEVFDLLNSQLDVQLAKWKSLVAGEVAAFNAMVRKEEIPAVSIPPATGSD